MSSRKLLKRSRTSADYSDQEEHNPPKKWKWTTRSNNDSPADPHKLPQASQTLTPVPVVTSTKVSPPTAKMFTGQTSRRNIDLTTSSKAHEHSKQENQHKHDYRLQKQSPSFDAYYMNTKPHDSRASTSRPCHAKGGEQTLSDLRNLIESKDRKRSPRPIDPIEQNSPSPLRVPPISLHPHDSGASTSKPCHAKSGEHTLPDFRSLIELEERKRSPRYIDPIEQNSPSPVWVPSIPPPLSPEWMPFSPPPPHRSHALNLKPYQAKRGQQPMPDLREIIEKGRSLQSIDPLEPNTKSLRMDRESSRKGKRKHQEQVDKGKTPRKKHRMSQTTSRDTAQGGCRHGSRPNQTEFFQNLAFSDPQQLHDLASKEPKKQLAILRRRREEFREFICSLLDYSDVDHSIKVNLIVKILSSLLKEDGEFSEKASKFVISELTGVNNHPLLHALKYIFGGMPMESSHATRISFLGFLTEANLFFKQLLDKRGAFFSKNLPIDAFHGSLKQLASQEIRYQRIYEQSQQLVQQRDDIRATSYGTSGNFQQVAQDGQDFTALPTQEELRLSTLPLDLQPNVIKGPYISIADYLTIHYRLLREDFIHPLRCALYELQVEEQEEEGHGVKIYRNVRLSQSPTCRPGEGAVFRVSFEFPGQKHVRWDRSKRLTYGSLLCLSADGFQTVMFATVAERKVEDLQHSFITVKLENNIDGFALPPGLAYEMVESPGYYHAYAPVVKRLKNIINNPCLLPFSEYLIKCSPMAKPPAYLSKEGKSVMNLAKVVCECDELVDCPHRRVDIFNNEVWSEMQTPLIDPSQKAALHAALTNELTVIQGPPGTGKTFIGLKIVEVLLRNLHRQNQNGPIVVVCYTNHALDQFMEGLLSIKARIMSRDIQIRRVGGRCKSENVEQYNIRTYVMNACRQSGLHGCSPHEIHRLQQKIQALGEFIAGVFVPSNFKDYCSILEQQTVNDLDSLCGIRFLNELQEKYEYGRLASWLSHNFWTLINNWHEDRREEMEEHFVFLHHRAIEDDRRLTTEEEEGQESFLSQVLGRDSVGMFLAQFRNVEPLTRERAKSICSVNKPGEVEDFVRLQLFKYFLSELKTELQQSLKHKKAKQKQYMEEKNLIMVRSLQKADVIGITTTGAAMKNSILSQIEAKTVIIEEAAEVLEAHVVTTLTRHTQHLILIGDHKQLRPKTNDHILARDYHLDVSLFERLITNGFPYVSLEVQHRMRPEISDLVSTSIYDGKLKNHPSTETYNDIRGLKHNVFFVDHEEPESTDDDLKSKANDHEAHFLARLCKYLLQQGYRPEEITVITPYTGQMFRLQESFRNARISTVRITPIDSYQGEENEIILLSLVRSNTANKPGFVKDSNRICVALSRAKQGFYCIGNFSLFCRSSPLWRSIVTSLTDKERIGKSLPLQCTRHEVITEVTSAVDFDKVVNGGCDKKCGCRLPKCNHICPRNCHPGDEVHEEPCEEPCPKYCPSASRHRCKLLCYQDCGECLESVEKVIPSCGHKQQVSCYQDPSNFICQLKCQKALVCGHRCRKKCGELCTMECPEYVTRVWPCGHEAQAECYITEEKFLYRRKCKIPCKQILECGHRCAGTCGGCYQGRLHKRCQERCERPLMCGHTCSEKCALNCPPCKKPCIYTCHHGECGRTCSEHCSPCPHRCEWKCDHIECKENCGEICNRQRCDEPCSKSLPCGHPCPGMCGEPCPTANDKPICKVCDKETWTELVPVFFGTEDEEGARFIQLVDCGHIFEVSGLDHWMDMEPESERVEIKWKECFTCKKPIHKTRRYGNIIKKIVADMNEIKKKKLHALGKDERQKLENEVKGMAHTQIRSFFHDEEDVRRYVMKINERLPDSILQREHVILSARTDAQEVTKTLEQITSDPSEHHSMIALKRKTAILAAQTKMFTDFIKDNRSTSKMTNQIQFDILAERRRVMVLATVYELQHHLERLGTSGVELEATDAELVECITKRCETRGQKVERPLNDDAEYLTLQSQLQEVCRKYGAQPLTMGEREMIIKALSAKPGSWYKCPKGHYYQISDCGGAMVEGKCPECGAIIGGRSHQLRADNDHAGEFDDSRHAAWSTGANLEDYDQEQLRNLL